MGALPRDDSRGQSIDEKEQQSTLSCLAPTAGAANWGSPYAEGVLREWVCWVQVHAFAEPPIWGGGLPWLRRMERLAALPTQKTRAIEGIFL